MSKLLKDLNRMIADHWVAGEGGLVTVDNPHTTKEFIWVYSGSTPVYAYSKWRYRKLLAAIKGAGWNTRHAQAIAAGLQKHPIHIKAIDATSDLSIVIYFDKKGRAQHVRMEAGMNTPAVMLYLAYRRYSNRLNRQLKGLYR
jgi:hypothetical protein